MRYSSLVRKAAMTGDASSSHLGDKSALWKKIREALVVNPASGTGAALPTEHRSPPPGSRPELYTMPSSKASDIAANPYSARDFRRMYPQTMMLQQDELATLLLAQGGITSLPTPTTVASTSTTSLTATSTPPSLASLYALAPLPGSTFKPPRPPGSKYVWTVAEEEIPHDEDAYFPMWSASAQKIA